VVTAAAKLAPCCARAVRRAGGSIPGGGTPRQAWCWDHGLVDVPREAAPPAPAGRRRAYRFRIEGRLDRASGSTAGTVVVNPSVGLFSVRPLRRRRTYDLPLSTVGDLVVELVVRAEARALARAKKKAGRR
jgi:hypothetical protein